MTRTVDAGTFQILALLKWTEICFEKEPNINYQNSKKKSISWETNIFFIYLKREMKFHLENIFIKNCSCLYSETPWRSKDDISI